MNRKTTQKIIASAICAGLIFGTAGSAVYAAGSHKNVSGTDAAQKPQTIAAAHTGDAAARRDETVYVIAGQDGSVQKIIVNNWLQNTDKAATLTDFSSLTNIQNVKGDETFTTNDKGGLVWDAQGNDIYYQGTSNKEVPVKMHITYKLDGKEITPEELSGKSGKVTIRFDYENTSFTSAKVKGKAEKIYVPFTVMTGTMLDTNVFRNVTVTNGKMENMGEQIAVVGIAFPGLQENLNLKKDELEIPDYVEITADVEKFEMGTTMTLVSTALAQELDSDQLDLGDLSGSVGSLKSGMDQLMGGSDKLYGGLCTLLEQSQALVDGINQLSAGSTQLQAGADALNSGASQLQGGAKQLYDGLTTLDANSAALNGGAEQVFNTLLTTASSQLAAAGLEVPGLTIANYADVLNGVIASLDENAVYQTALQQVTAGVEEHRGEIQAAVTDVVRQQVSEQVVVGVTAAVRENVTQKVQQNEIAFRTAVVQQALGMTLEQYDAAVAAGLVTPEQQEAVDAAVAAAMQKEVETQMESDEVKAIIAAQAEPITQEKLASEEVQGLIATNTENQVQKKISEMMASPEVQAQLQAAAEGAQAVIGLKASLDSYNSFYLGLRTYTSGVSSAAAGANQLIGGADALKNGTGELCTGVGQLAGGIQTMKDKSPALIGGITQLRDGSKTLSDGLGKFMQQGIQKLIDLAENDMGNLTDRLTASIDAAKGYTTFSSEDVNTDSTVKFIYKTDAITVTK